MVLAVALVLVSAIDFAVDGVTAPYLIAFSKRGKAHNRLKPKALALTGARALSVPVS